MVVSHHTYCWLSPHQKRIPEVKDTQEQHEIECRDATGIESQWNLGAHFVLADALPLAQVCLRSSPFRWLACSYSFWTKLNFWMLDLFLHENNLKIYLLKNKTKHHFVMATEKNLGSLCGSDVDPSKLVVWIQKRKWNVFWKYRFVVIHSVQKPL